MAADTCQIHTSLGITNNLQCFLMFMTKTFIIFPICVFIPGVQVPAAEPDTWQSVCPGGLMNEPCGGEMVHVALAKVFMAAE